MKQLWQQLSPNGQRGVVIGSTLAVLAIAVKIFTPAVISTPISSSDKAANVRHIFTDRSPEETGLDSLSADVKSLSEQQTQLNRTLEDLQETLNQQNRKPSESATLQAKIQQLEQQLAMLKTAKIAPIDPEPLEVDAVLPPELVFRQQPLKPLADKVSQSYSNHSSSGNIVTHTAKVISPPTEPEKIIKPPSLTAGAVLTGRLLTGLDAPTGKGARREPFPALIRLQLEALLPNLYRSDVWECFLLVSGYGDLSSERAYLRGETISCICEDGRAIEQPLDAYVVGDDGKAGVRGRVVSKQGQLVARSLMSGFLGGISQAFGVKEVPTINLTHGLSGGKPNYQSMLSPEMFQGAAVKGAGQALDRVANFYLEMAENLFPVIEIDAGKQVDIIVKKGSQF
ncbi:MAG: TrbI/VirB10 family protein (plasmid) [Candidatus Symbiodolus clandestinus]